MMGRRPVARCYNRTGRPRQREHTHDTYQATCYWAPLESICWRSRNLLSDLSSFLYSPRLEKEWVAFCLTYITIRGGCYSVRAIGLQRLHKTGEPRVLRYIHWQNDICQMELYATSIKFTTWCTLSCSLHAWLLEKFSWSDACVAESPLVRFRQIRLHYA